jgi:hypothetical protein
MPKQDNQVIGSFVIRDEGDGCLFIKYHHGESAEAPFAEAAKLMGTDTPDDVFVGTYRTVWVEDNFNSVVSDLVIERNPANANIFRLMWNVTGTNELIYEATAMLYQDLLVGAYWD